jgi:uncharacterized protein YndB with AHSA1/START domain
MTTLYHQVWIDAPAAKIYDAIATAEGLGRWWAPHESTETDAGFVLSHDPGPAHGMVRLKVLDRIPNKRVEWECISTHPSSSPASAWTGTHLVWEISERGNIAAMTGVGRDGDPITVLEFRHTGWNEKSEYLGFCNFAWGEALALLKKWCETR